MPKPPTDAEVMSMLRSDVVTWRERARVEAAAGAKWRLLAAVLLARIPGRMAEFNVAEVGALRAEGVSIDDFESPDGTVVVRLHVASAEAAPGPKRGEPPSELGGKIIKL